MATKKINSQEKMKEMLGMEVEDIQALIDGHEIDDCAFLAFMHKAGIIGSGDDGYWNYIISYYELTMTARDAVVMWMYVNNTTEADIVDVDEYGLFEFVEYEVKNSEFSADELDELMKNGLICLETLVDIADEMDGLEYEKAIIEAIGNRYDELSYEYRCKWAKIVDAEIACDVGNSEANYEGIYIYCTDFEPNERAMKLLELSGVPYSMDADAIAGDTVYCDGTVIRYEDDVEEFGVRGNDDEVTYELYWNGYRWEIANVRCNDIYITLEDEETDREDVLEMAGIKNEKKNRSTIDTVKKLMGEFDKESKDTLKALWEAGYLSVEHLGKAILETIGVA